MAVWPDGRVDRGHGAMGEATEHGEQRDLGVAPLLVGVGASAGGLEAVCALVRAIPRDAPLGLVVVQHLDPAHASNLPELIGRQTALAVAPAADGALVGAGEVHVIPPGVGLRIAGGRLRLVPRPAGPHLAVDDFFESLAADRGRAAAGVVLSGTGADGAQGVCALRRAGACTFAQDHTAMHTGMPDAAVATGCVDHVLGPAEIGARLVEVAAAPQAGGAVEGEALEQAFSLLRRASGIDFTTYKISTVQRRFQRRAALGRHPTVEAYLRSFADDPSEVAALAEDMLVHVTGFFRDPPVFAALAAELPGLLSGRDSSDAVRLWVPGCSSGEEVYSLVIALLEAAPPGREPSIRAFGTDLSERAVERARAGTYPRSIADEVSPGRLQRFFTRTESGYRVAQGVRDLCVFARQDVVRDPPFSRLDLVSCRNLMIYLSAPAQRRVVPVLHYSLRPGGVLLLGTSESPGEHPGFEVIDATHRIYRRRFHASRGEVILNEPQRWQSSLVGVRATAPPARQLEVQREADRLVLARCAPPGVVVADDLTVVQFRGQIGPFLEPAPGSASLDLLRLVREELREELRTTLDAARRAGAPVRGPPRLLSGDGLRGVSVEVIPLLPPGVPERHFAVLFHAEQAARPAEQAPAGAQDAAARGVEQALRDELAAARSYLQSVIEQLEAGNEELVAANEEIVSSNEELQSTNEELQTAKEELQATNEELSTINDELVQRNADAVRTNDDLNNVLSSVGVAILILGRDGRIRRFTPAAARLLNLIPADLGRPISDIRTNLKDLALAGLVTDVLDNLAPRELTVADEAGRWYQLVVRPYLTADRKVDGVVVTLVDVDLLLRGQELLTEARDYAESIVDTVREPLLVLDERRYVHSANRSFYEAFHLTRAEVVGKPLDELGIVRWSLPDLSAEVAKAQAAHEAGEPGDLVTTAARGPAMQVVTRALRRAGGQPNWLLLAFEDLSGKVQIDAAARRSERTLREMLNAASEAIVMSDWAGRITYANAMAARTFGYGSGELVGASIDALVPEAKRAAHVEERANFLSGSEPRLMGRDAHGRRKDGSLFPAEISLSVMVGEEGPLAVAFIADVTARREAEARIQAYKSALQQMAFDAALSEERQRRRIAADLHDNIGQALALAMLRFKALRAEAGGQGSELAEGIGLVERALADMRSLTFELSPPVLYDLGLPAALAWLGEQFEERHHLRVAVHVQEPLARLADQTAAVLFRAVRELLTNVVKHAHAPSAAVRLASPDSTFVVQVEDRGAGFDASRLEDYGATRGFGLFSVREQVTQLGGTLQATSKVGVGTKVELRIPLDPWVATLPPEEAG